MIRLMDAKFIKSGLRVVEYSGLSTDEKPTTGLATGSSFLEVDTANVFFYDEESESWIKAGGS